MEASAQSVLKCTNVMHFGLVAFLGKRDFTVDHCVFISLRLPVGCLNKAALNGKYRRFTNFRENGYRPHPERRTTHSILVPCKGSTFHRVWFYLDLPLAAFTSSSDALFYGSSTTRSHHSSQMPYNRLYFTIRESLLALFIGARPETDQSVALLRWPLLSTALARMQK